MWHNTRLSRSAASCHQVTSHWSLVTGHQSQSSHSCLLCPTNTNVTYLCNSSISVESESHDFRPDPDRSVNSSLLFTSFSLSCTRLMTLLPFPFIPSYLLQSFLNQTFLYHSTLNCNDVDSRILCPLSTIIQTTPFHFLVSPPSADQPQARILDLDGKAVANALFV